MVHRTHLSDPRGGDQDLREKVSTKMNDTYLKVDWQSEGVKTYGREVDLMLWDYCPKYE